MLIAPAVIASSHRALSLGAACVYATGAVVCHQRPERSFFLFGRQLPVCARCIGLYAGAALAAPLALVLVTSTPNSRARRVLILAALPTAVTWIVEHAGLVHLSNTTRFVAALPLGFAAAWLVLGELRGSRFEDHRPRPTILDGMIP
jgi:uncharacterized membrane protein